jgi:hypothetical protein
MNTHIANARTAPKRIRRSKDLLVLTAVTFLTPSIAFGTGFPGFLARDPPQEAGLVDFAHRERDRSRGERTLVESDPREASVRLDEFRPGAQDDRRRLAGRLGLGIMTRRRPAHGAEHVPDRRQAAPELGRDPPQVMPLRAHPTRV